MYTRDAKRRTRDLLTNTYIRAPVRGPRGLNWPYARPIAGLRGGGIRLWDSESSQAELDKSIDRSDNRSEYVITSILVTISSDFLQIILQQIM